MKIALFTETYLPYINGVVTHVKALRDGLVKQGHDVVVVTADTKTFKHYFKDGVIHCPAATFKKLYNYGVASPVSIRRLKLIYDFHPDIIHIHNEFGIGVSGNAIGKILDIPVVYTLHTMWDDYLYYIAPKPFIPALKKISHKYLKNFANHAAALTGPSMKVQEFLTECGVKKSVNVVPNPVELDIFNPSNIDKEKANEIRKKYNIADNDILISFCGRLGKEKNVDMLIDFFVNEFTSEDGFKLLILGEGPCLEDFKLHAKKRNAEDMIFFTGKIEHHDLPNYYGACQLYITASLSDTNSISMKEAMATGLPVIHIKDPLNKGQVEDGVNGFIYENQQQMRDILVNYKNMTDTQKEELKNSVINSVKIYGCEALAEYLVGVYKSAIAGKYEEKSN